MSNDAPTDPASHYDRVTAAWALVLGDDLHYGIFPTGNEDLSTATAALTQLMLSEAAIGPGHAVLDVGCGTGAPACVLAARFGARVTGITTSSIGIERSRSTARSQGVTELVSFELRDGTDNGFPDDSFDRIWVLESSHLMRDRGRLLTESARVLRSGGKLVLCDVMLRRRLSFDDVRSRRHELSLLRHVFGDARMEPLEEYCRLARAAGLVVTRECDLSDLTRPTFKCWRDNADRHRSAVIAVLGESDWQRFIDACVVLEHLWDEGVLGYGLLAASKP